MREQSWNPQGRMVSDLEWIREPEGLICYDRIKHTKRQATSEEVARWNSFMKMGMVVPTTPAAEQIKPSFLDKLWNFFRG